METKFNTVEINKSQELIIDKLGELGFFFNTGFDLKENDQTRFWVGRQTFNIDPKTLGLFAPAIKEMTATVTAMFDDISKKIVISYSYKHPSGSNGYEVVLTNNTPRHTEWVDRSF